MKNLALLTIMCIVFVGIYAQNRIQSWDTDKITSITVELTTAENEVSFYTFKAKADVYAILSFLKEVDFKENTGRTLKVKEPASKEFAKIVFQGQRDQVYLFRKIAHIGKTTFVIKESVIEEFE
jgi:hypothetical protein